MNKFATVFNATLLVAMALLCACRDAAVEAPSASVRVDSLFSWLSAGIQPGAAVMVIRDGEVIHEGLYGFADTARKIPITSSTNFRLASVSKQFATMAIMVLKEDGKLSYDDPVARYVPQLAPYPGVTIRHIMQHTSGLPDYYDAIDTNGRIPTNVDAAELLGAIGEPDFAPGDRYEYSNAGYDMLGPVVEAAAGMPFVDFVRTRIFEPLCMSTSLVHDHQFPTIPNRALGYDPADTGFALNDLDPLNGIVGSGGVYSNLNDLYRWDQALLGEAIVSNATLAEALTAGVDSRGESIGYGFGWRISTSHGHPLYRHSGSWVGFRTHIARIPDLGFSVIILSNRSDFEPEDYIDAITTIYLGPDETPGP